MPDLPSTATEAQMTPQTIFLTAKDCRPHILKSLSWIGRPFASDFERKRLLRRYLVANFEMRRLKYKAIEGLVRCSTDFIAERARRGLMSLDGVARWSKDDLLKIKEVRTFLRFIVQKNIIRDRLFKEVVKLEGARLKEGEEDDFDEMFRDCLQEAALRSINRGAFVTMLALYPYTLLIMFCRERQNEESLVMRHIGVVLAICGAVTMLVASIVNLCYSNQLQPRDALELYHSRVRKTNIDALLALCTIVFW